MAMVSGAIKTTGAHGNGARGHTDYGRNMVVVVVVRILFYKDQGGDCGMLLAAAGVVYMLCTLCVYLEDPA